MAASARGVSGGAALGATPVYFTLGNWDDYAGSFGLQPDDPFLEGLARPQEGRSMRVTSTMRVGEVRRGTAERKLNPLAEPRGDRDEASNFDNFTVAPGQTHVLLDARGPGG